MMLLASYPTITDSIPEGVPRIPVMMGDECVPESRFVLFVFAM